MADASRLSVCVLAIGLAGCGLQDAPADAAHKAALQGQWRYESQDGAGVPLAGTLHLGAKGLFSGTERRAGSPDEGYSGEWFVTDGLFKLKTTRSGGQRLGTAQTGLFTCALQEVRARVFDCRHASDGRAYRFERLAP
ncbi:MAG: hypothetical protein KA795_03605 [Burkholderiaceae bacterium]|nr:hypothetical protein [Burkholderiaceae bacterium]